MHKIGIVIGWILSIAIVWFFLALNVHAHVASRPDLNGWFDSLYSEKSLCCDFTEAESVQDVDWETKDGHYRVRIDGQWIDVPDNAVVKTPNKFGPAVVWPIRYQGKVYDIRCFIPGAGT